MGFFERLGEEMEVYYSQCSPSHQTFLEIGLVILLIVAVMAAMFFIAFLFFKIGFFVIFAIALLVASPAIYGILVSMRNSL